MCLQVEKHTLCKKEMIMLDRIQYDSHTVIQSVSSSVSL